MYSKVKIAGHPLHPMLIAFPVTFYTTTLVAFVLHAITSDLMWWQLGLRANVAAVVTALVAAIPGFIDWRTGIPERTRAKRTGQTHMLLNVGALALFAANLAVQRDQWRPVLEYEQGTAHGLSVAIILCAVGFVLTFAAGFLGWSLVQTHHVGVDLTEEQRRAEPTPLREPNPLR